MSGGNSSSILQLAAIQRGFKPVVANRNPDRHFRARPRKDHPMPENRRAFGNAIRELRKSNGLLQKNLVDRVPNHYSDVGSISRVERGERIPSRDAAVDLLILGIELRNVETINAVLRLAGYEGLTLAEIAKHGLTQAPPPTDSVALPQIDTPDLGRRTTFLYTCAILGCVVVGAPIASRATIPIWFTLLTSALYAGLFAVSLFLETAFGAYPAQIARVSVRVFCFIFLTSIMAIVVDAVFARQENLVGMWIALAISLAAAIAQWIFSRSVLPAYAPVRATFRVHTAQAAHLKNTAYFLLLVVLFWLPPVHCIAAMLGSAHGAGTLVRHGAICPQPLWLWLVLAAILVASLPMGARVLENLESDDRLNRYQTLFYARALLYFGFGVVCLLWYTFAFAHHASN